MEKLEKLEKSINMVKQEFTKLKKDDFNPREQSKALSELEQISKEITEVKALLKLNKLVIWFTIA